MADDPILFSERKHSDQIKIRRELEQATGLSPNQIRQRLKDFDKRIRAERSLPAARQAQVEPKGIEIVSKEELPAKPIAIPAAANGGGVAPAAPATNPNLRVVAVNNNGSIDYINVVIG